MLGSGILDSLRIVLTVLAALPLANSLSGEHVCNRIENYTLTAKETYTEPVMVQTFTWCLQVPPRCEKTRIEMRERYRIKTNVEQRSISECCEGYVIQELHGEAEAEPKCIPFCNSCENGLCLAPNFCQCESGYQGDSCAHQCPPGSWGKQCMQQCDCASGESCNPVSGICECPAGWQGPGCKLACPEGRWGLRCESVCNCVEKYPSCDPETGICRFSRIDTPQTALPQNWTQGDLFRAIQVSGLIQTETSTSPVSGDASEAAKTETGIATRISRTTEHVEENVVAVSEVSFPLPYFTVARPEDGLRYANAEDGGSDSSSTVKKAASPHPGYVKSLQKVIFLSTEQEDTQSPHDVTLLIVVGSIVSLCLTTLAALVVFYMRSKLFESIPLSIYSSDKKEASTPEKCDNAKSLKITNTTLPPLPTFVNPVFATNPETALITFDASELNKHYDNRTGTISIRVSGNIRDLLESHYDRPPTSTCRHNALDQNTEHVYDEIPLTVPLCVQKEA
ncbi:uncharacterized protein LOC124302530 isoform X1 [Neodiprion virginianus]|uniref:uncharacterized protein LOC124302530 isoform X1 n=1 Tax=Neodiprion virginianus TaxID=2961670 RepID=UPI001EE77CD7|nr:uncharacterized protein LOC124302530 isoform X1 [Neodiprion virginianus]XP_046614751.1 uncharacterized protein LOC124302530 isoform X1 [Neodiprion virginianus]XP_046614752.1 uncharacterized protein LOC124302530 isoform X1 [Neodiprion virginianus]